MNNEKKNNNLDKIEVGNQSPKFGGQVSKAGKYGQSQFQFIKQSKSHPVHNEHKIISLQELSKHTTEQSAWISLKGFVYDVTGYLAHHPGGKELLEGCGKQSQKLFNQHHSWVNAKNILNNCLIGVLENS